MPSYYSPGVYVEEVPSAVKAIAGASTSIPGFIGIVPDTISLTAQDSTNASGGATKLVEFKPSVPAGVAKFITNWTEFAKAFGGLLGSEDGPASPTGSAISQEHLYLAHAVYGFFNNGGSSCYVVRVKGISELDTALNAFAAIDPISMVLVPGATDDAVREKLVAHCKATGDRFAIFDGPETVSDLDLLTKTAAETPGNADPNTETIDETTKGQLPAKTDLAAVYFPWISVFDPATKLREPNSAGTIAVPPSGHMAGIYARVDSERGVHKAPANEVIFGALGVTQPLSKASQDLLNPKGVNCIRVLNGNILVWGGRTVGGDANKDLKYINVRRTLLFIKESIDEGIQWAVFEPNTPDLWQKITRNVSAFLTIVWRSGALFGNTPQEAFYVKCDAETNPPELRELGQVVTEIGIAPVRPAEFVIFRISQIAPES